MLQGKWYDEAAVQADGKILVASRPARE